MSMVDIVEEGLGILLRYRSFPRVDVEQIIDHL